MRDTVNFIDDDGRWKKHSDFHWSRSVQGKRLDYWPTKSKFRYEGTNYEGPVLQWIADAEEHSHCPFCGTYGVGFGDSEPPADYCHHDPADVRTKLSDMTMPEVQNDLVVVGWVDRAHLGNFDPKGLITKHCRVVGDAVMVPIFAPKS